MWAVNRTITALQRAFLLRSCSDGFFESRTRPCLLHQIKRCSAPCTHEIEFAEYAELVREARDFLSGRSQAVKEELAAEMEKASTALDFERAAIYRDRLAALSTVQSTQGINPRSVEEADVFAIHQGGGFNCIEVFFFRTGQNWGNRAYFPKADRSLEPGAVLGEFLAQFYDDKPVPGCIILSHEIPERELLAAALSTKASRKVDVSVPRRGERKELVAHALVNAREALARKLADTSSQQKLLTALADLFKLPAAPRRIEVYDNSHIQGSNAVGAMIVAGPEGFRKNQYRKFNIRSADLAAGDDYGMMREVLQRRFKRLIAEAPKLVPPSDMPVHDPRLLSRGADEDGDSPWPDLVVIDGGAGQLGAARETARGGRRADRGGGQGAGPRRRQRDLPYGGAAAAEAAAARSAPVLRAAAAGRGPSVCGGIAPSAPQKTHPRRGIAGDRRHRTVAQARAAPPFRHAQSHRARLARRPRQGARHQRRNRTQDLRLLPRSRRTVSMPLTQRRHDVLHSAVNFKRV